jgi:hypothetical protein
MGVYASVRGTPSPLPSLEPTQPTERTGHPAALERFTGTAALLLEHKADHDLRHWTTRTIQVYLLGDFSLVEVTSAADQTPYSEM